MTALHVFWDETYAIGNEQLDSEHKHLFVLSNATLLAHSKEELYHKLLQLRLHFESHFRHEERLMLTVNYPDLEEHADSHRALLFHLNEMLRASLLPGFKRYDVYLFMVQWMLDHIVNEDSKILEYVNSGVDLQNINFRLESGMAPLC